MRRNRISKPQLKLRSRRRDHRSRRVRGTRSSQSVSVFRRLALFPKTTESDWLSKLTWFGSIALKLFTLALGITDDFTVEVATTGAGTIMLLGPGDFAPFSPFSSAVTTTREDKEVIHMRTLPFERHALRSIKIKIVPSADMAVRGGTYAALLTRLDTMDVERSFQSDVDTRIIMSRYSCKYDDIIKNPKSIMAPVGRSISLSLSVTPTPHNIEVHWNTSLGYINRYPNCVLLVAFSDLASSKSSIASNYSPGKSLFEVHMHGELSYHEPSDSQTNYDTDHASFSAATPKIFTANSQNINVSIFDESFDVEDELNLKDLPPEVGNRILLKMGRLDLVGKLREYHAQQMLVGSFEHIAVQS